MAILLLTAKALRIILGQNVTGPLGEHSGVSCIASRRGNPGKGLLGMAVPKNLRNKPSVRKLCECLASNLGETALCFSQQFSY